MQDVKHIVANEFEAVNQLIIDQLQSNVPLVENIGHYIVDAGGKRLRPMLALLSGKACSQPTPHHITLAAVVEFIHTATLLHDDVVDISALRRGRPTANAEWGNASSVLVGDFLYTRAFQLLVSIGRMDLMTLMADTTNSIAEGEVLQLIKAGNPNTTEQEYFQVIDNKTAVLFAASTAGGAMIAGANQDDIKHYYQYGLHLGQAFQLIDDVLDYEGNPEETGKNIGDDLAEGKPTLPLIYAMKHSGTAKANIIRQAITEKSSKNITAIIRIIKDCKALDYTKAKAAAASLQAIDAISNTTHSLSKEGLIKLAHLATNRTS
jgi:octaprenyl-diphosphate synthase